MNSSLIYNGNSHRTPCVKKADDFWAFSQAGRKLADLHINYEKATPYPVKVDIVNPVNSVESLYRVEKMRYGKAKLDGKSVDDKTTLLYNERITLTGIPLEAYEYVVNGKPALDWVVERQCVKTDKDSGIVNDANLWAVETMNDPKYPLELFQRVVTVSLETMKIVQSLPPLDLEGTDEPPSDVKLSAPESVIPPRRHESVKTRREAPVVHAEPKGAGTRTLIILPEFAGQIMDGEKPVEFRTVRARAPQRVAIAASKVRQVLGMATIRDCLEVDDGVYGWELTDVVRFVEPQPYEHKNGCVVWIEVPVDVAADSVKVVPKISHDDFLRQEGFRVPKRN